MTGISPRTVKLWVNQGLISPAHASPHSKSPNQKFYSDLHVREIRALIAVRENNTRLDDLGQFLKETQSSIIQYAKLRGLIHHA